MDDGDGLASGIGWCIGIFMSIFCSGDGDACGVGDEGLAGISIPGIFCMSCCCGDAVGAGVEDDEGICIPGIFSISVFPADGEGVGDCDGIDMPGIPRMSVLFGAGRALFRRAVVLAFRFELRFDFGLAFDLPMFMPGMSCMSCP